jgi:hypothetical protein
MSGLSPRASAPPCLPLFIKGPLKEGWGLLLFGASLWLSAYEYWEDFTLYFLVWEAFGKEENH